MIITVVLAAIVIGTLCVYGSLPEPFPVHFNSSGHPTGWSTRAFGAWLLPAVGVVGVLLFKGIGLFMTANGKEVTMSAPSLVWAVAFAGFQGLVLASATSVTPLSSAFYGFLALVVFGMPIAMLVSIAPSV